MKSISNNVATLHSTDSPSADLGERAHSLFIEQQREWPVLRDNVAALDSVKVRSIDLGEFAMRVQFNPARIVSTAAKIDAHSIGRRKCFLCAENRPPEQCGIEFNGHYIVLANPFPIFPEHFTIAHAQHLPQRIAPAFGDLLDLAQAMASRYAVFYNGPRCGASAPDHLHFQAGLRDWMPLATDYDRLKGRPIVQTPLLRLYAPMSLRPFLSIESTDRSAAIGAFAVICAELSTLAPAEEEPMMNVIARFDPMPVEDTVRSSEVGGQRSEIQNRNLGFSVQNSAFSVRPAGQWRIIVFPRAKHRPSFYHADGEARLLLSPGAVDLGGVCITPIERDFERLTADHLRKMLSEVMLDPERFASLRDRLKSHLSEFSIQNSEFRPSSS